MKKILFLIIAFIFVGCSNTPDTITVKGTIIGEDKVEMGPLANALTGMWNSHGYLIETDTLIYIAMTPSTSVDPLDSNFTGTFVLGKLVATGTSEEYFGGKLSTTKAEFRKLISYK